MRQSSHGAHYAGRKYDRPSSLLVAPLPMPNTLGLTPEG
jgi:hypothetical protein